MRGSCIIFWHPSYPYKSSEQLFREWSGADFPKPTFGFRFPKATKCNERNNCQLLLKGAKNYMFYKDYLNPARKHKYEPDVILIDLGTGFNDIFGIIANKLS